MKIQVNNMKRILTIQDISCVGKCSLTVALPIISAFGVETAVLPTAVLSNHTAFNGFTFNDLTDDMPRISKEWKKQEFEFDAIYTGYLGSIKQVDIVSDIFDDYKRKNNFILVDPVMADNGKLYTGFDEKFALSMKKLCKKADIIVPNLTEASFMLDIPYKPCKYNKGDIEDILKRLTDLGCKIAVLTGVSFDNKHIGVYGYDSSKNEFFSYFREKISQCFHGTGDVFASSLCGALASDKTIDNALEIAVDFTVESILKTIENPMHNWYGVEFEKAIPYLIQKLSK